MVFYFASPPFQKGHPKDNGLVRDPWAYLRRVVSFVDILFGLLKSEITTRTKSELLKPNYDVGSIRSIIECYRQIDQEYYAKPGGNVKAEGRVKS